MGRDVLSEVSVDHCDKSSGGIAWAHAASSWPVPWGSPVLSGKAAAEAAPRRYPTPSEEPSSSSGPDPDRTSQMLPSASRAVPPAAPSLRPAAFPVLRVKNTFLTFDGMEPCCLPPRSQSCGATPRRGSTLAESRGSGWESESESEMGGEPQEEQNAGCCAAQLTAATEEAPTCSGAASSSSRTSADSPHAADLDLPGFDVQSQVDEDWCPESPSWWPGYDAPFMAADPWCFMGPCADTTGFWSEGASACPDLQGEVSACPEFSMVAFPADMAWWTPFETETAGADADLSEEPHVEHPESYENHGEDIQAEKPLQRRTRKRGNQQSFATPTSEDPHSPAIPNKGSSGRDRAVTLSELSAGGHQQRLAVARLQGNFAHMAFDAQGCRLAQAALDVAEHDERIQLVSELQGSIRAALDSPYANFVVQKVVEVMPAPQVAFVVEELMGAGVKTAMHRYGCRTICRLLEHCSHAQIDALIMEILQEATALCRHSFGNHVIRHILEHGTAVHRQKVARSLLKDPMGFASHRTASCVVEQALSYCASEERRALLNVFLRDAASLARLACGRYGSYVAQAILSLPKEQAAEARALLTQALPALQVSKYGKRVLHHLGDLGTKA